ncbi:MAG TPA: rod shape-determining protein MreC [Phycisphaerales bacterium]|jgi:cell shape-determining protein MreC|nr:rod shape-determining protein MreC [Phycisphaerales bacterium]
MSPPRLNIALVIAILAVVSLLPRPVLRTVTYLNRPVMFLLSPVRQTAWSAIVWLAGRPPKVPGERTTVDADTWNAMLRELNQTKQQVADLQTLVRDLSRGVELNPNLPVRQIAAPVIGFGTDINGGLLTVRAGTRDGVDENAVVVVRGVYLVGLVLRAEPRTSIVVPITDPAFSSMFHGQRKFLGAVMLDEQHAGPTWKLDSIENGRMIGRVFYDNDSDENSAPLTGSSDRPPILPDMLIRLRDPAWPASAQMLVVGIIERVEPGSNNRPIVTVRPLQDLAHVGEVLIRVPDPEEKSTPPPKAPANKEKPHR